MFFLYSSLILVIFKISGLYIFHTFEKSQVIFMSCRTQLLVSHCLVFSISGGGAVEVTPYMKHDIDLPLEYPASSGWIYMTRLSNS